jgi:hypothetical protein
MFPSRSRVSLLPLTVLCLQFITPRVLAQDVPRLALSVKDKIPVAAGFARSMATTTPVCDGAGNIYVQFIARAPASNLAPPVTRISADGQQLTKFSLDSVPGLAPDASIDSYAVTPRGEVLMFGYNGDVPQLFTFRDDGQFDSIRKFDLEISNSVFAVFPTGEFLVRGVKASSPADKRHDAVFTGLFDRNGRFLKQITLEDEIEFKDRADFKDGAEYSKAYNATLHSLSFSQAISADDGNVYLVRQPKPLSVDVVSPGGEVLRQLTLKPPSPSFQAGDVKVAGGKIVVEFILKVPGDRQNRISDFTFSVFDAESGEKEYDYYSPPPLPGFLACYTPNYFTFLKIEENGLTLVRAAAR